LVGSKNHVFPQAVPSIPVSLIPDISVNALSQCFWLDMEDQNVHRYIDIRQHEIFRYSLVILPSMSTSSRLSSTLARLDAVLCTSAVSF
jgi:hypothetical protein